VPAVPRPAASPIGYLTDCYPATSHTFVQREVLALRALGVDVHTFSTHRAGPEHVLSQDDREAFATTFALLPISPRALLRAHAGALSDAPRAYVRAAAFALSLGRGARGRLWQLFYFAEAVLLWRQCAARGIRHVHAHFTRPAADAALLAAHLGTLADGGAPWTWSFSAHGADIYDTDPAALAAKVRDARFVVCVSRYGRAQLTKLVSEEHWPKLRVVHCGIDLTRYPPSVDRAARATSSLRILTVGRLVAVKGQAVLLDAFARLLAGGVDAELTIVGDGPLRADLQETVRRLGVGERVRFAGRVGQDDLLACYEAADVFALTSLAEGIPVVLMEAMATELPVVASDITGIPELVGDGEEGLLVRAGDAVGFAAALAMLARDPDRRARMGRLARRRVEAEFELRRSADDLHRVMREFGALAESGG
jgi:glycosyltransferase involved in cell wall biosynthesis